MGHSFTNKFDKTSFMIAANADDILVKDRPIIAVCIVVVRCCTRVVFECFTGVVYRTSCFGVEGTVHDYDQIYGESGLGDSHRGVV